MMLIWLMWIRQFDTAPKMQQTFYQQEQLFYVIRAACVTHMEVSSGNMVHSSARGGEGEQYLYCLDTVPY